jgi:cyclophilin family peptidyl-prolyl cis-trans isomerase
MKYNIGCISLLLILLGCSHSSFKAKWVREDAPDFFKAKFETTKGNFEIESFRKWSPMAVDRLYQLIKHNYFINTPIYRVVPGYVAQFGNLDSLSNSYWQQNIIPDEAVIESNKQATMAFARAGKETRGTQLFINLADNHPRLDTLYYAGVAGFPVIARVTKGMEIISLLFSYGNEPMKKLDSVANVNEFLKNDYPEMDYIKKAYIVK